MKNFFTALLAFLFTKKTTTLPPVKMQPIIKQTAPVAVTSTNPAVQQPPAMRTNVTITRHSDNGIETLGSLVATNITGIPFNCEVLELPWKNNQHDISCIPPGTYEGIYTYQTDLGEYHYELQNVVGRNGIFQHEGDFFFNFKGCQGLGVKPSDINGDGQIDITNSRATVAAYEAYCGKQPITVTIIGVQG